MYVRMYVYMCYCFDCEFLVLAFVLRTVCIPNVWGYTEIIP